MIHEPVINNQTVEKAQTVDVWEKIGGKIEILECPWGLLKVRKNLPPGVDPVKVVENYLKVIDIEGTKLLQKMRGAKQQNDGGPKKIKANRPYRKGDRRPNLPEPGEIVGKYRTINVYKDRIIDLYRKTPEVFTSNDALEYFCNCYKPAHIAEETARNKVYGYTNFLVKHGCLEKIGKKDKMYVFKFVKPPYGAEKPAQSDFDPEFLKKQKAVELEAMRRTV